MRPQLFKMAGDLKENEEGMADILQINDSLIRVLDNYKQVMVNGNAPSAEGGASASSTTPVENSAPPATDDSVATTDEVNSSHKCELHSAVCGRNVIQCIYCVSN